VSEVALLSSSIFPRAESLKTDLLSNLYSIQSSNVILARSLFLLIYSRYFEDPSHPFITPDDMLSDILLKPTDFVDTPNSLLSQLLSALIKQLCQDPSLLIDALTACKVPHSYFSFSVFPSLFGFYTSIEFCESAGHLLTQFVLSEIPSDLLSYLCLSFFFSAFFFCDTLWTTVRDELSRRPSFSADEAGSSIIHAVCHSLPLINTSLHELITTLELKRPYLLNQIVARFLTISFEIWWNHTGEGVGFISGDAVLRSLKGIADGSTVDITSALVGSLGECPVLPSFIGFCKMASETLIVSGCDCQLLVTGLRPVANRLPMFDALDRLADQRRADRFVTICFIPITTKSTFGSRK
jgi:hypothetical protein